MILKKVLGFLFLLFGVFCVLSAIGNMLRLTTDIRTERDYDTSIIFSAIVVCIIAAILFFWYGIKWISKRKNVPIEKIEDIGK